MLSVAPERATAIPVLPPLALPAEPQPLAALSGPPRWRRALRLTWTAVLVAAAAMLAARAIAGLAGRSAMLPTTIRDIANTLLIFAGILGVHEGGHAIGGLAAGWRLQSILIGPVRFIPGRPFVAVYRGGGAFSGLAILAPARWPADDDWLRRSLALLVAAGPTASIVVGSVILLDLPRHWQNLDAHRVRLAFAAGSFALGIGALIPTRGRGASPSDGMQLLDLLVRRPDRALRERRVRAVFGITTLYRPRNWSRELVARFDLIPAFDRAAFEYHRLLDVDDPTTAQATLARAIDQVFRNPGATRWSHPGVVALEAAAFEAAWRGDACAAQRWFALGGFARAQDPHAWHVARAAIATADGDMLAARGSLRAARRAAWRESLLRPDLLRVATTERIAERIRAATAPRPRQ